MANSANSGRKEENTDFKEHGIDRHYRWQKRSSLVVRSWHNWHSTRKREKDQGCGEIP